MRFLFALHVLLLFPAWVLAAQPDPALSCQGMEPIFEDVSTDTGPGFAVAISYHGEIACVRNWGMADINAQAPISELTRFNIASVSKSLTAWVALSLAQTSAIDLEAPLSLVLPDAPKYAGTVTLRQLLTHTSGVRDTSTLLILSGKSPAGQFSNGDMLELLQRQLRLNFTPDESFLYSNGGYLLAALALESTSGLSLSDLLDRHALEAAGMEHTALFHKPDQAIENLAQSYSYDDSALTWQQIPYSMTATGSTNIYASASDLVRWGKFLLTASRNSSDLVSEMVKPAKLKNGDALPYGLGLEIGSYRGQPIWFHSGSEAGYRSVLMMLPELDLAIAILGNGSSRPQARAEMLLDQLFGHHFSEPAASRTPGAVPVPDRPAMENMAAYYEFEPGRTAQVIPADEYVLFAADPFGILPMERVSDNELLHAPSQVRVTFSNLHEDGFHSLSLTGLGATAHATRIEQASMAESVPLTGQFYSDELDVVYELNMANGSLEIKIPGQDPLPLTPLENGRFVNAPVGLAIEFDGAESFLLHTWRVKYIRFVRKKASAS